MLYRRKGNTETKAQHRAVGWSTRLQIKQRKTIHSLDVTTSVETQALVHRIRGNNPHNKLERNVIYHSEDSMIRCRCPCDAALRSPANDNKTPVRDTGLASGSHIGKKKQNKNQNKAVPTGF